MNGQSFLYNKKKLQYAGQDCEACIISQHHNPSRQALLMCSICIGDAPEAQGTEALGYTAPGLPVMPQSESFQMSENIPHVFISCLTHIMPDLSFLVFTCSS